MRIPFLNEMTIRFDETGVNMESNIQKIKATIEKNKNDYIGFLSNYIQIDSTNPSLAQNSNPLVCHKWMQEKLSSYGIFNHVDFWESGNGFSNVVAVLNGEGNPLLFAGHSDTVPVTETQRQEWRKDAGPWSGAVVDGKIYGRGASDMKAGCAAPLMAMHVLHSLGIKPRRSVYFSYVMSEENGGREFGVDSIIARGYKANECIVMEPSNNLAIVPAIQGEFYFTITVHGLSYHIASRHHTLYPHGYTVDNVPGRNAIELAIEIIQELQRLEKELGQYILHPLTESGSTTINISGIESKGIFSAGAEVCKITGSMLYNPSITQNEALEYFKNAIQRVVARNFWLKKHPPIVEIPYLLSMKPPVNVDIDYPLCEQLAESARAFDKEPVFESCLSTSDANYLQDHGIVTITMGPGANEYGVHSIDEYVPVDAYLDAIGRYAYFLSKQ